MSLKQLWVSEYPDATAAGLHRAARDDGPPDKSGIAKKSLTIQHVDHYARWIRVAGAAGVISAVGQSGLCHQ